MSFKVYLLSAALIISGCGAFGEKGKKFDIIDYASEYKGCLNEIANEFVVLIEKAQSAGEVDKAKNALELAEHVQIQVVGLRTFAKIQDDKSVLETKIENMFSHYPF